MALKSSPIPVHRLGALLLLSSLIFSLAAFAGEPQDKDKDDDKRDNPVEREQWFLHGRTYQGRPASALLRKAQQQRDRLRVEARQRAQLRVAGTAAAPPAPAPWTELGPAPMRSVTTVGDDSDFGVVTGRATSVVVDQNDPTGNTVYVGGAYGGVWKSTSAANSDLTKVFWKPIIDDQPTTAVGALAVQPGNGNVLLVGTGEANSSTDSYYGLGILRSTDAGTSWTLVSSANGGLRPFHGLAFAKIAFSSDNPNVVVAATAAAVQGTTVGAEMPPNDATQCANAGVTATCRGLYYSLDGGVSWNQSAMVDPGGAKPDNGSASSVVYNAQQHRFYAASRGHGFYVSSDGITFTRLGADAFGFAQPAANLSLTNCPSTVNLTSCPLYRAEMAVVPGRDEMYAWYVDSSASPINGGIYRTTNGGATWTGLNVSGITNCGDSVGCGTDQGDYNLALTAIPNNTATDIYAGAINIYRCQLSSINPTCTSSGFVNLTHVYGCTPSGSFSKVHPDQHAFDFLQGGQFTIYFANDGGIYRALSPLTANGVPTSCQASPPSTPFYPFDNLNGTMGSMTQFVWFSQHPTSQFTMLGGTQDNGSPAIDSTNAGANGLTWRAVQGGDGGFNDINPNNGNEWFAAFTRVSINRCANGTSCTDSQFNTVVNSGKLLGDSAAFYMPYMLDPQSSTNLLLGSCRVWRVTTAGTNAIALSQKFDGSGGATACQSTSTSFVSAIASGGPVGGSGSQVIYAGTEDGKVFANAAVGNSTTTWTQVSSQGGFSNTNGYPISGIAIDPNVPSGQTALVTVMGFQTQHVWRTTDAGTTWADITGNLPDSPADAVVVDKNGGTIYVGTDVGVFSTGTPNGAATVWTEVGPATGTGALPNVAVTRLAIFNPPGVPARLRVSTYGRGIWEMALGSSSVPDYSLTVPVPDLVTFPGQTVTFNGTLGAFSGYNSAVTLSCDASGNPLPQTCTPNPATPNPAVTGSFTVTASNPTVQDFSFKVKGVGSDANTLVRQVPVSLRVIDFTLGVPQPSSVTNLPHGNSTTVQVGVTSLGSFNQQVTFACSGLPSGWTCSASPVTLTPLGTATTTLTINTAAATPAPQNYSFNVTATAPGLVNVKQQSMSVQVITQADFNFGTPVFTSPTSKIGQSLTSVITLTSQDGYSGVVNLSCTGAASVGVPTSACTFAPPSVTVGAAPVTSTLTVATTSGVAGNGQIAVSGTDGTLTHTAALPFSLTDYTLSNLSVPNSAAPGNNVTFSFQLTPLNGYNNALALSCDTSTFSVAVACSFDKTNPLTLVPGVVTTVNASIAIPANEPNGTYTVVAKTNDVAFPTLTHNQTTASFQIASNDFTLSFAMKTSDTVVAGTTSTSALTVGALGSFNSAVVFTISGCPAAAVCSLAPNPVTPPAGNSAGTTLSVVTKSNSNQSGTPGGFYTLVVTGTSGTMVHSVNFNLTVNDFTEPQNATPGTPANATVIAGGTAAATFQVVSQGNFNSAINFTVGGCPSLATCLVMPNPATPTPTTPVTATITVMTKAASVGSLQRPGGQRNYLAMWMALPFGTMGIVFLRRKRGSVAVMTMIVACALLAGMAACGGGGGGGGTPTPVPQPGTPAGNYTIVVTGTSGTTVHTTNFNLIVQ